MHICHLTSAHSRYDSRIFQKQCKSIAESGNTVTLILADGLGNEFVDGVKIIDVGILNGRINRMLKTTQLIFHAALKVEADIYEFHDPELLFAGLRLKNNQKRVVFDSHEDAVGTILVTPYLNSSISIIISKLYKYFEKFACRKIDGVIAATPAIENIFLKVSKKVININNYPIINESEVNLSWDNKVNEVCYVGSIAAIRGVREVVKSFDYVTSGSRLNLVGNFAYKAIETEVKDMSAFANVNEYGYVNRAEVQKILMRSIAGIVTSHPLPTYIESLPIKMFEYMAAGIPFIISDFPYWRKLLEGYDCCIFVNPLDPKEIAKAIDFFVSNQDEAKKMGERGKILVNEKYNWKYESEKLLCFYRLILSN
jgi:glycosyltransferase involved in cell wall biosynthesis